MNIQLRFPPFLWILIVYLAIVLGLTFICSCEDERLWEVPNDYDCMVIHNPDNINYYFTSYCSCGDYYVIDHGDWQSVGIDGYKITELLGFVDQDKNNQFPEWMPCMEEVQFKPGESEAFILYLNTEMQ